jgi:hypothetical protein
MSLSGPLHGGIILAAMNFSADPSATSDSEADPKVSRTPVPMPKHRLHP